MGVPAGEAHDDTPRAPGRDRGLQVPRLPEHDSVSIRRDHGRYLPVLQHPPGRAPAGHLPVAAHRVAAAARRHHQLPRLALWLRQPRPHRLHHLPARQVLQAASRHVPAHHRLPQALPAIQVPGGRGRDGGRRRLHAALGQEGRWQEARVDVGRGAQHALGPAAAVH